MSSATIVVPCYNEASRLDRVGFAELIRADGPFDLLFVDDGSTDDTAECLEQLRARSPARIQLLRLDHNQGKAEAVRRGLITALNHGAQIVGYYDADLATPPRELLRLMTIMQPGGPDVLIASRVALLGRAIERSSVRHYTGRVFATAASLILGVRVYDTQCGAKLLRRTPQLAQAVAEPFLSRWAFDVELLGRLLAGSSRTPALAPARIVEEPLQAWRDIPGSKLGMRHMIGATLDMAWIACDLRTRRAIAARQPVERG